MPSKFLQTQITQKIVSLSSNTWNTQVSFFFFNFLLRGFNFFSFFRIIECNSLLRNCLLQLTFSRQTHLGCQPLSWVATLLLLLFFLYVRDPFLHECITAFFISGKLFLMVLDLKCVLGLYLIFLATFRFMGIPHVYLCYINVVHVLFHDKTGDFRWSTIF